MDRLERGLGGLQKDYEFKFLGTYRVIEGVVAVLESILEVVIVVVIVAIVVVAAIIP